MKSVIRMVVASAVSIGLLMVTASNITDGDEIWKGILIGLVYEIKQQMDQEWKRRHPKNDDD